MSVPLRLDCESRLSTEASLMQAFGCSASALRDFVADPSHVAYFEDHWQELPEFEQWLYEQASIRFGPPTLPSELCWFHGTRAPLGTTFAEGLLPLGRWLPRLHASVLAILDDDVAAKDAVNQAFERQGGLGMHFRNKVRDPLHWGPYAILVREVAGFARDIDRHDYLGMPEIIEDLCDEIRLANGLDLLAVFQTRWKPAIVKFVAPAGGSSSYALATALWYLNEVTLRGKPGRGAVWCYDGANEAVPAERILRVDWVVAADEIKAFGPLAR